MFRVWEHAELAFLDVMQHTSYCSAQRNWVAFTNCWNFPYCVHHFAPKPVDCKVKCFCTVKPITSRISPSISNILTPIMLTFIMRISFLHWSPWNLERSTTWIACTWRRFERWSRCQPAFWWLCRVFWLSKLIKKCSFQIIWAHSVMYSSSLISTLYFHSKLKFSRIGPIQIQTQSMILPWRVPFITFAMILWSKVEKE